MSRFNKILALLLALLLAAPLAFFANAGETVPTVDMDTVEGTEARGSSQGLDKLFDGDVATKYLTNNDVTAAYVQFALTSPAAVNTYKLTSGNDAEARDPKDWNFYASNDGENWTLLDSRTDEDFPQRCWENVYTIENTTEYLWYKLDILSNNGTDPYGLNILQFSELSVSVVEGEAPVDDRILVDYDTISGPDAVEPLGQMFDGTYATKCVIQNTSPTIVFALTRSHVVTSVTLTTANDWVTRDPRDWSLYGSEDGENWTLLTSCSRDYINERNTEKTYYFENETSYQWYKFDVEANWGNQYFQLAELTLGNKTPEKVLEKVDVDPATIDGTAANSESQAVTNLFDGSSDTKYLTFTGPTEAIFALNAPKKITHYALTSANDHAQRDPADWTFYGSNDKETWTVLDARTGEVFEERYQTKTYEIAQAQKCLWYKLEITAAAGEDPWGVFIQLADLAVYETIAEPTVTPVDIDASTVTTTAAGTSGSNAIANLCDLSAESRYLTQNTAATVTFALTEAAAVNRYSLISSKDHNERYPSAFDFYGSNDGETWTLLDSRTNQGCSAYFQKINYNFENDVAYLWYKLEVTAVGSGSHLAIDELLVYSVVYAEEDENEPADGDVNGDGLLNITDVTALLDYLRLSAEDLAEAIAASDVTAEALDINGDGELNITDVTALLDLLA